MIVAFSRPFFPLFLHVLGAMALVGAMGVSVTLAWAGVLRPRPALSRATLWTLLVVAIPAWIVMRIGAQWIYSKEDFGKDPGWVGIGFGVADAGLIVLLVTTGLAFWWARRNAAIAGRIAAGLASIYLVLLAIAWLAMSGKWS